jgi:hypothetical protein
MGILGSDQQGDKKLQNQVSLFIQRTSRKGLRHRSSALPLRQYHILYNMVHIVVSRYAVGSFTRDKVLLCRNYGITVVGNRCNTSAS